MNCIKASLVCLALLCSFSAFSQQDKKDVKPQTTKTDSVKKRKSMILKLKVHPDTTYVQDYDDFLMATLPFSTTFLNVDLTDKVRNKTLNFRPHNDLNVGLNMSYRFLGLGYSGAPGFLNPSDPSKGTTNYSDYFFTISSHRYLVDVYLEDFQGFFVNNYKSFPGTANYDSTKTYPLKPNMRATSAGATFYYLQNWRHFSYAAAFDNSEEQLKSAGTIMYGGYLSTFNLSSDSSLVTYPFTKSMAGPSYVDHSFSMNMGISVGYMYTLVLKHHLYATLALNPGLSYMYYQSHAFGPKDTLAGSKDTTFNVVTTSNLGFKLQSRIAFGYNGPRWYAGFSFNGDAFFQNESASKSTVDYSIGSIRVYYGYRFNVPGLNKLYHKLMHQSPEGKVNLDAIGTP